MKICKICYKKHYAKGYCSKHYQQEKKYGGIYRRVNDRNEIIVKEQHAEIILYSGKKTPTETARAIIDKKDISKIKNYKWCLSGSYVVGKVSGKTEKLHIIILGKRSGYEIDHINGNKLDNRTKNLRHVTRSQNNMNKNSIGVTWNKPNKRWIAQITKNKKGYYLGSFINREDAIIARREAELKYFGEFAHNRKLLKLE